MKKKSAKSSTPETLDLGDILPKDASAVDVFLLLAEMESNLGGCFSMQFDPDFLRTLAREVQELQSLRNRVLE